MNKLDALAILNLTPGYGTSKDITAAYRKAATLYHPDRNPAGLEMMKLINAAYEVLKNFEGTVDAANAQRNLGAILNEALNAALSLRLTPELCGVWIWVSNNNKLYCNPLKAAGYLWSHSKGRWYFRPPQEKSRKHFAPWSMDAIRERHGSKFIRSTEAPRVCAA